MQPLGKKKSCNLQKNKSCNLSEWEKWHNLSTHKITKPLDKKNWHNLSTKKKCCKLSIKKWWKLSTKKITQPLPKNHAISAKKNHAISRKINHATWMSEWEKSHNLSTHKITLPLHTKSRNLSKKNHATSPPKKHCENCKTLPSEHHIGCQICKIASFKSTGKKRRTKEKRGCMIFLLRLHDFFLTTVTAVTTVKITFSVLLERVSWHIWQPMWCSQGSVLQFSQCLTDPV